ncbi:hypothetical protein [Nonomuraea coxensis]|uniref:hypothetical protein n=1 Tax=Nonomuraea coxensis TaxID=404386 RepID=UPI0009FC520F
MDLRPGLTANAVNDHGQVAGNSDTTDGRRRGFFWNGSSMTALPPPPSPAPCRYPRTRR